MYTHSFTIQYVDIDSNNNLSDYGLLKYLQEIACLHADSKKYGLKDTPENRLAWIILDWKIQVFSRPGWDKDIHIKTWASNIDNIACYRDFEIKDSNDNLVAIASSKWVLVNIDKHHITRITPEIKEAFEPIEPSVFKEESSKSDIPNNFDNVFAYTILERDIDTNKHLNNLNYVMLAKEALPEEYKGVNYSKIEVTYKHQCVLGDNMKFMHHINSNNEHVICIKNSDESVLHAIVIFK